MSQEKLGDAIGLTFQQLQKNMTHPRELYRAFVQGLAHGISPVNKNPAGEAGLVI